MRVCPVCGTPVMEGSNFCAKCGAGLRTAPKPRQGVKAGVIAAIIIGGMAVTAILSFLGLAILGFALEDSTRAAIIRRAEGLDRISRERISDEFQKILTSPHPEVGVTLLGELGLLPYVLPCGISPKGAGNLSALPADFILRMACLQWGMDGEALEENLRGLRLPTAVSKQIRTLARRWLLPSRLTPRKAREWRHALGELAAPTLEVRLAAMGAEETGEREMLLSLLELVRRSEEAGEPVRIADLAISGDDLIELGFKPGRLLQDIFCDLLEVVWDHPEKNNRETLLQEAIRRRD